jgi:chromosome segregation ATPase
MARGFKAKAGGGEVAAFIAGAVGIALAGGAHLVSQSNELSREKADRAQAENDRDAWKAEALNSREEKKNLNNSLIKSNQAVGDAQNRAARAETSLVAAEQGKKDLANKLSARDQEVLQLKADKDALVRKVAELEAKIKNGPKA